MPLFYQYYLLPAKKETYTTEQLNSVRNAMVDFATLQLRNTISDHKQREIITAQLQSQKGWHQMLDKQSIEKDYQNLLANTQNFILDYIHSDDNQKYPAEVIDVDQKSLIALMSTNFNYHVVDYE